MRDVTEFSVGDILGQSFSIYFRNLPTFVPMSLIAFVPSFAVVLLLDSSSVNDPLILGPDLQDPTAIDIWGNVGVAMREAFVSLLCLTWLQAGLAFGVVRQLRGGTTGFVETILQGLRMLAPAILVALVVAILTGIGVVLLIVPGIIVALILWVAVPAAVIERSGLRALGRSHELTNGFKGQIFGLALILGVLQLVVMTILMAVLVNWITDRTVVFVVSQLVTVVLSGIWATATAVTYHDLRVIKEGVDSRSIARVFE